MDQRDPIIRLIRWLCISPAHQFFLFVGFGFPRGQMANPVMYLTCLRLSDRDFLSNLRSVQIHFATQRGSLGSNRRVKEQRSSKHSVPQGGRDKASAMSQKASKSRAVVRAQLGFCYFEVPDSPPDYDTGNSEMSDSEDSYQSGHAYPVSIFCDAREMLSQRAREARERREERIAQGPTPFMRRPVCPGHVIEGDGETAGAFLDSLSVRANEWFWFKTLDCCTLVWCLCWKRSFS